MEDLISKYTKENNIDKTYFLGKSRKKDIVMYRFIFFYLIREKYKYTYECIGAYFNRDHATVLHGEKRIRELLEIKDKEIEHITTKSRLLI